MPRFCKTKPFPAGHVRSQLSDTETVTQPENRIWRPSGQGSPIAGLIADSSGNLYGTTERGGTWNFGVVFKLSPSGYSVLYSFTGGNDGANPYASLVADSSGNLYGTTQNGGGDANCHCGVVFKLSPKGTETVLYSFTGSDGAAPHADLIADNSGNLYGTTTIGGASGQGVVFELTGTGFVTTTPTTPFSAFNSTLNITFGKKPNTDSFSLKASFTLGSGSNGINPRAEAVTLQVGTFTTTVPPGSFTPTKGGGFTFSGVINGVTLNVKIAPTAALQYSFDASSSSASLTGTVNPVPVTLTIGDDSGTTSINARGL